MTSLPSTCPKCGLHYRQFRSGYTWQDAFESLWMPDRPPEEWISITEKTVRGRLWEFKQQMWEQHLENCSTTNVAPTWEREEY